MYCREHARGSSTDWSCLPIDFQRVTTYLG